MAETLFQQSPALLNPFGIVFGSLVGCGPPCIVILAVVAAVAAMVAATAALVNTGNTMIAASYF